MAWIEIPFSAKMRAAIADGRKCCTSRSVQKGEVGDLFVVAGRTYRIVDISPARLTYVRDQFFRQEGCESPEAFDTLWRSLHRGHFSADGTYYVHWFARVEGSG